MIDFPPPTPLDYPYGLEGESLRRLYTVQDRLRALGFWVSSIPLQGWEDKWLNGLENSLNYLEEKLTNSNKFWKTKGHSQKALYHLHSNLSRDNKWGFEFGFCLSVTSEQTVALRKYQSKLDRGAAEWDKLHGVSA